MFSCLQILEAFLWFVLITLLNVTLIILTLSVSRLLNLLLRLVAFLLFLNPQCLASISRWITASSSWKRFCLFVCRALSSIMVICMLTADRKSGSAGMPRPISYAVFCLKKKSGFGHTAGLQPPPGRDRTQLAQYPMMDLAVVVVLGLRGPVPPRSTLFPTQRSSDLFLNPQCLASISRWITASSSWKRFCLFVCRALSSIMVICMLTAIRLLLTFVMSLYLLLRS